MTETELCEVVITAPDPRWLKDFSRKLVELRLCASAHNFAPVRSIYRWRGDIYEREEGRVSLHTRLDRVAEIVALAKQDHPYEVPGISTRAITDGNPDYLAWITQETRPNDPASKHGEERTKTKEPRAQRVEPRPDHRQPAPKSPEGADASAQHGTTKGGVRSDGRPGPSTHRRSPAEREALEATRGNRLSARPRPSADGTEPKQGPERTPRGPEIGPQTRGFS